MNEKQGTRVKANDRTVIYMCWEKSVFYNAVTLGISTMPGQASSSGVVDQDINKLHSVLCSFVTGIGEGYFVFLVLLHFYF